MSERNERVTSLIREFAATFVQQEANTDPLITVTRVNISQDHSKCTIFFTTMPEGREQDAQIFLKRISGEMRRFIMKKSNLKIIPHFDFAIDAGERHRQHTDEVFREIEDGTR